MDIKKLKNTVCKNWNKFNDDPPQQSINREKLLSRHHEKFQGFWRMDIREAIGTINSRRPKVDKMNSLGFKDVEMDG
jgi:hypothetical protein